MPKPTPRHVQTAHYLNDKVELTEAQREELKGVIAEKFDALLKAEAAAMVLAGKGRSAGRRSMGIEIGPLKLKLALPVVMQWVDETKRISIGIPSYREFKDNSTLPKSVVDAINGFYAKVEQEQAGAERAEPGKPEAAPAASTPKRERRRKRGTEQAAEVAAESEAEAEATPPPPRIDPAQLGPKPYVLDSYTEHLHTLGERRVAWIEERAQELAEFVEFVGDKDPGWLIAQHEAVADVFTGIDPEAAERTHELEGLMGTVTDWVNDQDAISKHRKVEAYKHKGEQREQLKAEAKEALALAREGWKQYNGLEAQAQKLKAEGAHLDSWFEALGPGDVPNRERIARLVAIEREWGRQAERAVAQQGAEATVERSEREPVGVAAGPETGRSELVTADMGQGAGQSADDGPDIGM